MKLFPHLTLKPDGYICSFFPWQKLEKSSKNFYKVLENKQITQFVHSLWCPVVSTRTGRTPISAPSIASNLDLTFTVKF